MPPLRNKIPRGPCFSLMDDDGERQRCVTLPHRQPARTKYTWLREVTPTETAKRGWQRKEPSGCHLATKYKYQQPRSREGFSQKRDMAGLPGSRGEGESASQGQPTETCLLSLWFEKTKRENYRSRNAPLAGEQKRQWWKHVTRSEGSPGTIS